MHPLQSKAWEEFRKKWGNETARVGGNLLTLHKVPFLNKRIGIFEKGPEPTSEMIEGLKEFGRKNKLIFIKLEPDYVISKDNIKCSDEEKVIKILKQNEGVKGKTIFTPTTFWIDLTKSEEDLLKSFKPKTRYNIKLAQKYGVKVVEDNSDYAFNKYIELTRETTKRQGFYAHSEKYHRMMWEILRDAGIAHLLTAKYKEEIITTWILFTSKDYLYFPYGASTELYKNVMSPNLMMWEAIKFGKKKKLKFFDLWGREPGKGFTKFKEGYNPTVIEFLGTWDLVIDKPMYYLYRLMDYIRWRILRIKSKFVKPGF